MSVPEHSPTSGHSWTLETRLETSFPYIHDETEVSSYTATTYLSVLTRCHHPDLQTYSPARPTSSSPPQTAASRPSTPAISQGSTPTPRASTAISTGNILVNASASIASGSRTTLDTLRRQLALGAIQTSAYDGTDAELEIGEGFVDQDMVSTRTLIGGLGKGHTAQVRMIILALYHTLIALRWRLSCTARLPNMSLPRNASRAHRNTKSTQKSQNLSSTSPRGFARYSTSSWRQSATTMERMATFGISILVHRKTQKLQHRLPFLA